MGDDKNNLSPFAAAAYFFFVIGLPLALTAISVIHNLAQGQIGAALICLIPPVGIFSGIGIVFGWIF